VVKVLVQPRDSRNLHGYRFSGRGKGVIDADDDADEDKDEADDTDEAGTRPGEDEATEGVDDAVPGEGMPISMGDAVVWWPW
jgi:hypothetical protein